MVEITTPMVAAALSDTYGRLVTQDEVVLVGRSDFEDDVPDTTWKFRVPLVDGREGFMIVSGPGNPALIQRAAENIAQARAQVSAPLATSILAPVGAGDVAGATYAIWPVSKALPSSNRLTCLISRRLIARPILSWLVAFDHETLRKAEPHAFRSALQAISDDEELPLDMRAASVSGIKKLDDGTWLPQNCLQHGDFWYGNVLRAPAPDGAKLHIIDWAGMQANGFPFYDLARMLMSLCCSRRRSMHYIRQLQCHVGCDDEDVLFYVLAALGAIRGNLEHFPIGRFRTMADDVYRFMQRTTKFPLP